MRSAATRFLLLSGLSLSIGVSGGAQQSPAAPNTNDPRVGLKAGLRDAGQAARNLELVATLPKPEGFFDPKAPAGFAVPPERPEREANTASEGERPGAEPNRANAEAPSPEGESGRSGAANLAAG